MNGATRRLRRSGIGGLAAIVAVGTAVAGSTTATAAPVGTAVAAATTSALSLTRVSGDDRYETAARIAAATYPDGAAVAVLANGEPGHFPDALSGNYLAGKVGGPVLLTHATETPQVVLDSLAALKVRTIWLVGGTGVISGAQESALRKAGYDVKRLDGANRFETNAAVVDEAGAGTPVEGKTTAFVVTGLDFPDAVAAGAVSAGAHVPVLLTRPDSLSTTTRDDLVRRGIQHVVVVGGTGAVSAGVEAAIKDLGITVERLPGANRGDTSLLLADWALDHVGFSAAKFSVASGAPQLTGADALTGGVHAGSQKIPVLVTENVSRADAALGYTAEHADTLTGGFIYGGPGAVAPSVKAALEAPDTKSALQVLAFNDFHGNLEPPTGSSGRVVTGHTLDADGKPQDVTTDVGGVAYLATSLRDARDGQANTTTVAAGDLVGASPLLSAAFHDEPTIEAMNELGLEATSVGNHEFDEGYKELLRLQGGGCLADGSGANNQDSCPDPSAPFKGADFQYLAANVKYASGDKKGHSILPPYWIKTFPNGAKVGFIGMTLKGTPSIVTASGVAGLSFTDEVATANALVPELRAKGVNAIAVLIHQGAYPTKETWTDANGVEHQVNPTYDAACADGSSLDPGSPILPIARELDPAIDLVISGHTHQPYVCSVEDPTGRSRMVTSASSFGRLFTDISLQYDSKTHDIVRSSVQGANMLVERTNPAADLQKLVDHYKQLVSAIADKKIGSLTTAMVSKTAFPSGESPLGDLIADAQLADPSVVGTFAKPVAAFMNPGGIRADLVAQSDGTVTYEAAFTVQPFNNYLVSMDLTGADIYDLLDQQFTGGNAAATKVLQVSGLTYQVTSGSTPSVVAGSLKIGSTVVKDDASQTFRIVTNNFLADGGDNFPAFKNGKNAYFGGLDIDAFSNYLSAHSPYTPVTSAQRITVK